MPGDRPVGQARGTIPGAGLRNRERKSNSFRCITAEKRQGPYGLAYYILHKDLYAAAEVVDVVAVARNMTRQDVQQAIEDGVKSVVQPYFEQQNKLIQEQCKSIEALGAQMEMLRKELEKQQQEHNRPSWWSRLFKRR